MHKPLRPLAAGAFFGALLLALPGCAVVTVAATAVSITAGAVGLAADAAIGTAQLVGKGVGKAADALLDDPPDHSGIQVRYRAPTAADRLLVATPEAAAAALAPAP